MLCALKASLGLFFLHESADLFLFFLVHVDLFVSRR
jgi:hypothetical protein